MNSASRGFAEATSPTQVRGEPGSGQFVLTLCTLPSQVSLRPPRSPKLQHFTFFMSRASDLDDREQFYLHMGFFETMAEAARWAQVVRRHYPSAYATLAPLAPLRGSDETDSGPQAEGDGLTDTQVMNILENRSADEATLIVDQEEGGHVALIRPDDTIIRKALRVAVSQGAPVSFAVQLHTSERPIDLSRIRPLELFKGHTLYATESRRMGRFRHFLRVGFFSDPRSARQMAAQVRSTYASAAVVPVVESEVTRSREAAASAVGIPNLQDQRVEQEIEFDSFDLSGSRAEAGSWYRNHRGEDPHGESDTWAESDPLSESGVRHLKVEIQEQLSGRWKVVKLREATRSQHDE
ncbi:MAG: hypothetical protein JSS29_02980 [Proteobacteria bacterium]|nr:hypothetical protein [Pseudomonadota bacterium]